MIRTRAQGRRPPALSGFVWLFAVTAALAVVVVLGVRAAPAAEQPSDANVGAGEDPALALEVRGLDAIQTLWQELGDAAIRLPLAAALGAILALRPRRRNAPGRQAAVVETQIVLAVVGALIMLVVGTSLARAFGIVGVASLIRYRSKINDPKDAVVMLSALAVGLASGTGQFAISVFATLFVCGLLWIVEGFERPTRDFELSVKLGEESAARQAEVEQVLRRFKLDYELRGVSEEASTYFVAVPNGIGTDRVAKALAALAPDGKAAVEWVEKAKGQAK